MNKLEHAIHRLVAANRILAHEGVLDAYGHVSIRHPDNPHRYLIARSRSPQLVEAGDIVEYSLDGQAIPGNAPPPYLERYIHGAIYEKRAEIHAVVHSHADSVLPFTISDTALRPVIHTASDMGEDVPVWDIRDRFGDTNLLVTNIEQGRDLAEGLGANRVVLMRGHGFSAAGCSLIEVVKTAIYLPRNATILMQALHLGKVKPLSSGEIEIRSKVQPDSPQMWRAWEYWCQRAGVDPGPN